MFIDTHCHMNMMVEKKPDQLLTSEQVEQLKTVINAASENGVNTIINVGTSVPESKNSLMLAQRYANVWATVGIHPCDVTPDWASQFEKIRDMVVRDAGPESRIIGIGETGLDYYHQPFDKDLQERLFRAHIELACERKLPLVVHIREAGEDALRILDEYTQDVTGVIHCFSLDLESAYRVTEWGFCIGIDGPVTYKKNDSLREVCREISLEHIILETDAPFLPPQIIRGKQNHPLHIRTIAERIALERQISSEEVGRVTSLNVKRLFGI